EMIEVAAERAEQPRTLLYKQAEDLGEFLLMRMLHGLGKRFCQRRGLFLARTRQHAFARRRQRFGAGAVVPPLEMRRYAGLERETPPQRFAESVDRCDGDAARRFFFVQAEDGIRD